MWVQEVPNMGTKSQIFVDISSVCHTATGSTPGDFCLMLVWFLFFLLINPCAGQPSVVGGGALWASGVTIPEVGGQAARNFPQGTPEVQGLSLGIAIGSPAPTLSSGFLSVGVHRRFRVFHASVLGSATGDRMYSEQSIGLRGGLSTPRWGMGLGWDGNVRQIEGSRRVWPVICAGLSLFWNTSTTLHLRSSFSARQSIDDPIIVDGFSSAWLIDHQIGHTRLMGFIQQWETLGWDAGMACQFDLGPNWTASACGSVVWRRFSLCLEGSCKNWQIAAAAMISLLPGPGTLTTVQFAPGIRSP